MMYKMKQDGEIEDINEIISSYVNENNLSWKNKILWKMQNTKMQPK